MIHWIKGGACAVIVMLGAGAGMQKNAVPGNRWKFVVNAVVMHGFFPLNGCVRRDVIAPPVQLKNERLGSAKGPGHLLVRVAAESFDVDVASTPGKHQGIV